LPKGLFEFAKRGMANNAYNFSGLNINTTNYLAATIGYSHEVYKGIRVGANLKYLIGLAHADVVVDKMNVELSGSRWYAESHAQMQAAMFCEARATLNDKNVVDGIEFGALSPSSSGFAIDLGVVYDMDSIVSGLKFSASVVDLGFIKWNDVYFLGSDQERLDYEGMGAEGGMNLLQDFESIGEELLNFIAPKMRSKGETFTDKLSLTSHIGVEARIPSYQNLSFGLLGTYRFDGPYSWWETRASINFAPLRWFSITGNYAHSTYGGSYGAALNFHPGSINLFVGVDSFKPLLNMTPQYIPIDSLNTNIALGLNIAFGKYHGRFPKKVKKQSDTSE
jgi:hypothetical protein